MPTSTTRFLFLFYFYFFKCFVGLLILIYGFSLDLPHLADWQHTAKREDGMWKKTQISTTILWQTSFLKKSDGIGRRDKDLHQATSYTIFQEREIRINTTGDRSL
jgi:hypothetical protein